MNKCSSTLFCSMLILASFSLFSTANADDSTDFAKALAQKNVGADSKLDGILQHLSRKVEPRANTRQSRAALVVTPSLGLQAIAPDASGGYVVIDAVADNDADALEEKLLALGMENNSRFGRVISGRFPINKLSELEQVSVLRFARNSLAITNQGSVTSQGDIAMRSDVARQTYDVAGEGVNVGILSDSYDCLGGAALGTATGDLPKDVTVLQESDCNDPFLPNSDEGRAMLEIVHDVAPSAQLMFHTANFGQAGFANGIIALADAGADVIADDIRYLAEPYFQDGIIAQAVDQVNQTQDVTYFSAAGNSARDSYESRYREDSTSGLFNFAAEGEPVDVCLEVEVEGGRSVIPVLQWDEPFFSVSGGAGAQTDLGLLFFQNCDPNAFIDFNNFANIGGDPLDANIIDNVTNGPLILGIVIQRIAGPTPKRIKLVTTDGTIVDTNATQSSTSYGHAVARGAMGVGASLYVQTPPFFSDPAIINDFSSAGGTKILFDTNGERLKRPDRRKQPAIVGPDAVDTTFFGDQSDPDGTGFPNFFGTSASTPHVAAVAALMRGHNPYASADDIYRTLTRTAEDMDDPVTPETFDIGYDTGTGYGFINADAAISSISPPAAWYCDGKLATIIGTNKPETIRGTAGDDVIVGLNGNDRILGNGGNDLICGGNGHDTIRTGEGNDRVFGGNGNDRIFTGQGDDEVRGGKGRDHIVGGPDDDKLYGDNGGDLLLGKQGDDLIDGGKGRDEAVGGAGYDDCTAELTRKCE